MNRFLLIIFLLFVSPHTVYAQCVNPPAEMGVLIMNKAHKVMQYCNGDDWVGLWGGGGGSSGGGVPTGAVMAFDLADCPIGWSPMTSAQGRFLVGTGGGYNLGNTGGASSVTLSVAQLPSHNHTGTTNSAGNHSHTGATNSAGNHSHTGSTSSAGAHTHNVPTVATYGNATPRGIGEGNDAAALAGRSTGSAGTHTHSLSINDAGAHTHTVTINTSGAHTHSLTINNTGSGQAHENRPPYLAVLYCRKD